MSEQQNDAVFKYAPTEADFFRKKYYAMEAELTALRAENEELSAKSKDYHKKAWEIADQRDREKARADALAKELEEAKYFGAKWVELLNLQREEMWSGEEGSSEHVRILRSIWNNAKQQLAAKDAELSLARAYVGDDDRPDAVRLLSLIDKAERGTDGTQEITWTKEKPTVPGWYWYCIEDLERAYIVQLVELRPNEHGEDYGPLGIQTEDGPYSFDRYEGRYQFAGPIPEPRNLS